MSTNDRRQWKHLERDRYSPYNQLSVKGRRVRARTIYGAYIDDEEPMTPEEIAADRDLPLEAVLEAIAYCESNPPEIEEDFRWEEEQAEAHGMNDPSRNSSKRQQPANIAGFSTDAVQLLNSAANNQTSVQSSVAGQYQHLAPNPKSSYRQLFLKGRRIRAWILYCDHVAQAMSAEEIAEDRGLPVEAVREAIAYCASNPPEVRGDLIREKELMAAMGMFEPEHRQTGKTRQVSLEERARIHRIPDPPA
jgi:uncharacterized protein (DUF433 family)